MGLRVREVIMRFAQFQMYRKRIATHDQISGVQTPDYIYEPSFSVFIITALLLHLNPSWLLAMIQSLPKSTAASPRQNNYQQ